MASWMSSVSDTLKLTNMSQNAEPSNKQEKEERIIEIPEDLGSLLLEPASWPECCIYRVPRKLRETNVPAYTPQIISIGPLHCREKTLQAMNSHKLRYLAEFCQRTGKEQKDIKERVEKQKLDIQRRYEETFEPWDVELIVVDSVFIIELFLRSRQPHFYKSEFILAKPWLVVAIRQDLILLENQLPYFLLEDLYNFAVPNRQRSFFELTFDYFIDYIYGPEAKEEEELTSCFHCKYFQPRKGTCNETRKEIQKRFRKFHDETHHHFLDIIRKFRTYNHPEPRTKSGVIEIRCTATKLSEVGVKFEVDPNAWPLHVGFEDGVLKMPRFIADDGTETLVRNLMAFEQCHYPNEDYICNYFLLLDYLINSEDDIDVLIRNRVIINDLGNEVAVSKMVNNLCKQIVGTQFCYNDISIELNKRCCNPVFRTLAILKSVYFSNLWRGTGTVAALILLFLTSIQSVYSIMQMF